MKRVLHLLPDPNGGWRLEPEDGGAPAAHFDSLREAEQEAWSRLDGDGREGELVVWDAEGRIERVKRF
jgi:uncharacterized protein DUF2188